MLLSDFDYFLPSELIAQEPVPTRDASRLLGVDRKTWGLSEHCFSDILQFLVEGDLLVLNDTRVVPARLLGRKETGGKIELFLLRRHAEGPGLWECLLKFSKAPQEGMALIFPEGMQARVVRKNYGDSWVVAFSDPDGFPQWLERVGRMPLPPYIKRDVSETDRERYQTVFAAAPGAVAAPTAGLHFTESLLASLRRKGVETVPLTLHVGLGTFMPVRVESVGEHRMHSERFTISDATAKAITAAKKDGRRVIAVGTTTTRALEHAGQEDGSLLPGDGETDIFIYPGHRFKIVDGLITNFHLPKSTLLMLVSAFAGKELVMEAYEQAINRRFRFFSYGDAMFIY